MYINAKLLQPTEIIGGAIAIYENAWDNVDETISQVEMVTSDITSGVRFVPAQTHGDLEKNDLGVQSIRTNFLVQLTDSAKINENFRKINNKFYELLSGASQFYGRQFDVHESIFDVEPYSLLKYSGGQYYKAHYDGGTDTARSISAILYLNDDYTGGEIEFVNFGIKIKPKPGMLILFPSNYPYRHIAHPVETGTKYAIVTWLHDR
jgi:Rps23 Pro-64 3,4-dihydroxylase Tpa1-like proline 4-hydroxylase